MKIWVFEIGEPLPTEQGVRLHRYGLFTKYLASRGHEVTWWTSSFSHAPKKNFFDKDESLTIDGVNLKVIHGPGYSRNISLQRFKHNAHFAKRIEAELQVYSGSLPDLIIIPIPIIEAAMVVQNFAKSKGIPTVIDIRDEWPDEIVNLAPKFLRPIAKYVFSGLYRKMEFVCQNAKAMTGVSQRQVNYGKGFLKPGQNLEEFVFPLGYPEIHFNEQDLAAADNWLMQNFDPGQFKFNVCFFGTMGRYFDLPAVVEAAKQLPEVGFLLAGSGTQLAKLQEQARDLRNVFLPGWVNQSQIQAIMRRSDIGLAPYINSEAFSLPNKPFEYMSGGLMILSTIQGELKAIIESEKIGVNLELPLAPHLLTQLQTLLKNPELVRSAKKSSLELFKNRFSHSSVFKQAERHLKQLHKIS